MLRERSQTCVGEFELPIIWRVLSLHFSLRMGAMKNTALPYACFHIVKGAVTDRLGFVEFTAGDKGRGSKLHVSFALSVQF